MIRWAEKFKYKTVSVAVESLSPWEGKVEEEEKTKRPNLVTSYHEKNQSHRDLIKLGVEKCSNYFSNSSQLFQVY